MSFPIAYYCNGRQHILNDDQAIRVKLELLAKTITMNSLLELSELYFLLPDGYHEAALKSWDELSLALSQVIATDDLSLVTTAWRYSPHGKPSRKHWSRCWDELVGRLMKIAHNLETVAILHEASRPGSQPFDQLFAMRNRLGLERLKMCALPEQVEELMKLLPDYGEAYEQAKDLKRELQEKIEQRSSRRDSPKIAKVG